VISISSSASTGTGDDGMWPPTGVIGRLPFTDVMGFSEAGVRKASREETAGEFAPAVVSVYGDLAPVYALIFRFRTGTRAE
jgi:hypothetical protein